MRTGTIVSICLIVILLCALLFIKTNNNKSEQETGTDQLSDAHTIEYDEQLDTLNDDEGADAFDHQLDHPDSRYFVSNDYYNMTGDDDLHILTNFETYQQTTEYSCGCACALMVLNHYGIHDYNELDIARIAETDESKGTTVEGLVRFFDSLGWKTEYNADSKKPYFDTIEDCERYFIKHLDNGIPIMVDWVDWAGHWQIVIGLDECGTGSPYDDVLIMADPYDVTDHNQDGYYVFPFGRFFPMWREGPCAEKQEPYLQPFVVATP